MQNIHERLNSFAGAQWIFFLASFWGFFLVTGLANARILMPILWVLILFQLSVRWIVKGKRPDVAEFAVKRLQTTGVSLALVVLSDFVIATHILYTLPPLLPRSELKDFLDVFFLETVVLYGLSGMLMFVITRMITKQKANIQHKRGTVVLLPAIGGFFLPLFCFWNHSEIFQLVDNLKLISGFS